MRGFFFSLECFPTASWVLSLLTLRYPFVLCLHRRLRSGRNGALLFLQLFFFLPLLAQAFVTDFELEEMEVEQSRRSRIVEGTGNNYANNQVRFLQWLSVNRPNHLNRAWVSLVHEDVYDEPLAAEAAIPALGKKYKGSMKERCVKYERSVPPLDFEAFRVDVVLVYFQQLKIMARSKGVHRSSIRALFTHYDRPLPAGWEEETQAVFAGMKRREAAARQNGVLITPKGKKHRKGGKKPLTFQMYDVLGKTMYEMEARPFKVLFVLLCWNLMARSCSVDRICLPHLDWSNDALTIMFCHTKTNQTGEGKGLHARHIYANPRRPHICPILALGIYLITSAARPTGSKLFHSSREYDRVLSGLRKTIKTIGARLFELVGLDPEEWGLHSPRKGAASYGSNGPCAVHKSINDNRGGWAQAGQGDTYYGYVPEGDQLIGRVLACLPMNSTDFAILPPMFADVILSPTVMEAIKIMFPSYLKTGGGEKEDEKGYIPLRVLSFCLASVVYHFDWLSATITKHHPLRSTPLFTDAGLKNQLRALVVCKCAGPDDVMQPTGVPDTINHMIAIERAGREIQNVAHNIRELKAQASEQAERIIGSLGGKIQDLGDFVLIELDKRQVESHLTPHGMREVAKEVVSDVLQKNQLDKIGDKLDALIKTVGKQMESVPAVAVSEGQVVDGVAENVNAPERTYVWGGKIRLLPEDFSLPRESHPPSLMWNLYICGNRANGIPPLKKVAAWNCPKEKGAYKRYCEFLQLMQVIRTEVEKQGAWTDDCSADAASKMFEVGRSVIEMPSRSKKGYSVRPAQRAWTTVWKELRMKGNGKKRTWERKRGRVAANDGSSDESGDEMVDEEEEMVVVEEAVEPQTRPVRKRGRAAPQE